MEALKTLPVNANMCYPWINEITFMDRLLLDIQIHVCRVNAKEQYMNMKAALCQSRFMLCFPQIYAKFLSQCSIVLHQ